MKTQFLKVAAFICLAIGVSFGTFAQNTYILGSKSYSTTPTFKLYQYEESALGEYRTNEVEVAIGFDNGNGILIISKKSIIDLGNFKGNLLIYLDDNTVITCIDRGIKDKVNGKISAVYKLTDDEINKLLKSNINGIRYSVSSYGAGNNYIVYNSDYEEFDLLSGMAEKKVIKRINFPFEIRAILNK